jgi:hypothetical protein
MVVIDATTLLLLFDPTASPPRDPSTKKPLDKCKERIQFLLTTLNDSGTRVIVQPRCSVSYSCGLGTRNRSSFRK